MNREGERIGLDRQPLAVVVECLDCGWSLEIRKAVAWPRIVVLPVWDRTETADAYGLCFACGAKQQTTHVPAVEPEPQLSLFNG